MHYYQFNIGDYRKDTTHLLPIEHYIYRTLIDWYYLDEKPIPKETQTVIRRLRLGNENVENLNFVLNDYFTLQDDGWHQSRIDEDIINYHSKANVNRSNGKLGGRPKKTQTVIDGIANANPNESENNPNHKPLTINQEPLNKKQRQKTSAIVIALPDWIPKEKWIQFKEMRKKIRKPLTDEAERLLIKDLLAIKDNGYDPIQAIDNSIKNSWQGIFEPKTFSQTKSKMDISGIDYKSGINEDGSF